MKLQGGESCASHLLLGTYRTSHRPVSVGLYCAPFALYAIHQFLMPCFGSIQITQLAKTQVVSLRFVEWIRRIKGNGPVLTTGMGSSKPVLWRKYPLSPYGILYKEVSNIAKKLQQSHPTIRVFVQMHLVV